MPQGAGPSEEKRANSWFRVRFHGEGGGKRVVCQVSGGDPGYTETSKMLAESALCLAQDDLPQTSGQVTTAVAMGDKLIERLLFLEGLPNLQDLGKLLIGENVPEILRADLTLEQSARPMYQEAIAYCEQVGDYVSRQLFADILESEEEHIDWIETQLALMDRLGDALYLQSKIES